MAEVNDLTPFEWLARLGTALLARQEQIGYWRRYYDGDHDLPAGPNQDRETFKRFQKLARTNLCFLCAESRVHRTNAIGFRAANDPEGLAWKLWQAAKLDGRQMGVYRKAWSRSAAYVSVGVDPRRARVPRVTIEGPENVIVETDPADSSRRLAALRLWYDPIGKRWLATLYLRGDGAQRGRRFRWITKERKRENSAVRFTPAAWELRGDPENADPDVPIVPFLNGDEGEEPIAAFDRGIDVQNRINLDVLNRLTADRYAAFRQIALLNYEPEEDPVTGLPIAPIRPGVHQVHTIPPPEEPGDPKTELISLPQTDTSQMLRGSESDMRTFATMTLTPVYYLPGDLVNISGDTVAALDGGHIADVRQSMAYWGEGWEEVLQLMADVAELDLDLSEGEMVWARPENFNPGQVADYATKLRGAGVPLPIVAQRIGWSPQEIAELRTELAAEQFRARIATAGSGTAPTTADTPPGEGEQPAAGERPRSRTRRRATGAAPGDGAAAPGLASATATT